MKNEFLEYHVRSRRSKIAIYRYSQAAITAARNSCNRRNEAQAAVWGIKMIAISKEDSHVVDMPEVLLSDSYHYVLSYFPVAEFYNEGGVIREVNVNLTHKVDPNDPEYAEYESLIAK